MGQTPSAVGQVANLRRVINPPANSCSTAEGPIGNRPQVGNLPYVAFNAAVWLVLILLAAAASSAATRPHYGGVLRVEIRESIAASDSPEAQRRFGALLRGFTLSTWEPGKRAVFDAAENGGGRPFLDRVEVLMSRPLREQSMDLSLGKADLVELGPDELRARVLGREVWSSAPVRVLALVFQPRVDDARLREALALAVDRTAIHNVLLQHQGEISGALLPQWLSGYAFLFPASADLARARALVAELAAPARRITLAAESAASQPVVERIALNGRDAGLAVTLLAPGAAADVRLVEIRVPGSDALRALTGMAAALGLPEPPRATQPDALYAAEAALISGFRAVPLFHLPEVYGASAKVKGGPGISPSGEWQFESLWLDGGRP